MKIVTLNGQNHKGSSYHIGRMTAEKIAGDNEITEFFFPKDLPHVCLGCYRCIEGDENCQFYAEKNAIMQAVEAADVIIFTSPNYCFGPSAQLKAFIDLTFTYWMSHRPRACMFTKRALVVSTAAGTGAKKATELPAKALFYWGVPKIYRYGLAVQAMNWQGVSDKNKAKLDRKTTALAKKLSKSGAPAVGIKTRFFFNIMKLMHKSGMDSSPIEGEYWRAQGWFDKARPWRTK